MELKNTHYALIGIVSGLTFTIGFYFWNPGTTGNHAMPFDSKTKTVTLNAKSFENLTKTMEKEPYYSLSSNTLNKYEEIGIVNYNKKDPTVGEKPKEEPKTDQNQDKPTPPEKEKPGTPETPSSTMDQTVAKYASAYKVDEKWIKSLIKVYDNKNKNTFKQEDGSITAGVMMVNSETAKRIATKFKLQYNEADLAKDETNIKFGTLFLQEISKKNADLHYIFTTYRYGEQRAEQLKQSQNNYSSDFSKKVIAALEGKS